jgi:hypothetical protein
MGLSRKLRRLSFLNGASTSKSCITWAVFRSVGDLRLPSTCFSDDTANNQYHQLLHFSYIAAVGIYLCL